MIDLRGYASLKKVAKVRSEKQPGLMHASTEFEPVTHGIQVQCSNQLSYETTTGRAGHFSMGPSMPLLGIQQLFGCIYINV